MRFSSSLVAFVYLGFAAAAVIPTVPSASSILPVKGQVPPIGARAIGGVPANLGTDKLTTSVPLPAGSVVPKIPNVPNAGAIPPVGRRANDIFGDVLTTASGAGKGNGDKGGKGGKGGKGKGKGMGKVRREDDPDVQVPTVPRVKLPVSTPSAAAVVRRADGLPVAAVPTSSVPPLPSASTHLPSGTPLPCASDVPSL